MIKKIKELISIQLSRHPGRVVIGIILLLNILLITISSIIISSFKMSGTENMSFWEAAYCTITMILDAGCIQNVVTDIGTTKVGIVIFCIVVILVGMVLFTGAIIGYLTNYISNFIENANLGTHKLNLRDHIVILNWNSRGPEVINDLLYQDKHENVVVLVSSEKERIEREINEGINNVVVQENEALKKKLQKYSLFKRIFSYKKNKLHTNKVTVIVREGDVFSSKQLRNIAIEQAKIILILGCDVNSQSSSRDNVVISEKERGNPQSVKILMQVSDLTNKEESADNQKIIIEIEDDWTLDLVKKIIRNKLVKGKSKIVPVSVNHILGHLLSQFAIMPELNYAYQELFSNKGLTFYAQKIAKEVKEKDFINQYFNTHQNSIPLTTLEFDGENYAYYVAEKEKEYYQIKNTSYNKCDLEFNKNYWMEKKNIIILGHNSKIKDIMKCFNGFRDEWNYQDGSEIIKMMIIDDKDNIEKMNNYLDYPYVSKIVAAETYEKDRICDEIEKFVSESEKDTSILILSDDMVPYQLIDANAISFLIYLKDIINRKCTENPDFDPLSIDIIVEILNPKHYELVRNYSINNVVISNRYVSKMIMQIGEKEMLYNFYLDLFSYDSESSKNFDSKELYVKNVNEYFNKVPKRCKVKDFVYQVYKSSIEYSNGKNISICLGYVDKTQNLYFFSKDKMDEYIEFKATDKVIIYSNH